MSGPDWRGVMLGQGAIWFGRQKDGRLQLFTINGPIEGEPLCKDAPGKAPPFTRQTAR
jgi:hypothetical protein